MKVVVDDREPRGMLMLMDAVGLEWERRRLKVGDYVCGDVCVERKTVDDLAGSILDGRLGKQVERMKKTFKYNYVIITGRIGDKKSEIHENCLLGKITSLVVKHDVKVLMCDNDVQFCYLVKSVIKKHEEIKNGKGK